MSDVPRRLPRTQGQRIRNIAVTRAAMSGQGSTVAARPVPAPRAESRVYAPPTALNVVTGDSSGDHSVAIESTSTGSGADTVASAFNTVAIGLGARARAGDGIALGDAEVQAGATYGIAIGLNATVEADHGIAIGGGASSTIASAPNSVAIGAGAVTTSTNQIQIGGVGQFVVPSALCLVDGSAALWRLVVSTSGALSTVAYP